MPDSNDPLAALSAAARSRPAAKKPLAPPKEAAPVSKPLAKPTAKSRIPIAKPVGPAGRPAKRKIPLAMWIALAVMLLVVIGGIILGVVLMTDQGEVAAANQKATQNRPAEDGREALFKNVKPQ